MPERSASAASGTHAIKVLRDLYDSEINYSISSFWDGGYVVKLGDEMNGWLAETMTGDSWSEIAAWLKKTAIKHFPQSEFADKYRRGRYSPRAEVARRAVGSAAGPKVLARQRPMRRPSSHPSPRS